MKVNETLFNRLGEILGKSLEFNKTLKINELNIDDIKLENLKENEKLIDKVEKVLECNKILKINKLNIDNIKLENLKEKLSKNEYVVSVMGAMKSGKSTFIDALIGYDLMPNENAACTFTTTDIVFGEHDYKLTKIYENGTAESIESKENIAKLFHADVKKHRKNKEYEKFNYEVYFKPKSLEKYDTNTRFVLVDTPGLNEMSGLGVDKERIKEIFEKTLKRTSLMIFVIDYQYFKAEENLEIINEIKKHRNDMIDSNIAFVLNKIDMKAHKDKALEDTLEEVKKAIESWGIKNPKIYPIIARKALFGRMIEKGYNMDEYREEIEKYIPIIEKEIDGELLDVKARIENVYEDFEKESGILQFEKEILNKQFHNADENSEKSALNLIDEAIKDMTNLIKEEKKILNSKSLIEEVQINEVEEKIEKIKKCRNYRTEIETELKRCLMVKSFEQKKKEDYQSPAVKDPNITEFSYSFSDYTYSSYDAALRAGKSTYRSWKNQLSMPWEKIYSYYSDKLYYKVSKDNLYYAINSEVSQRLKDLKEFIENELVNIDIFESVPLVNSINVMPIPIQKMTYDNTEGYYSPYDNTTFIDTDYMEVFVGSGFFGDKYKDRYKYDNINAQHHEISDREKALRASSENFFKDYYKKYKKFMMEVKKITQKEVGKVELFISKEEKRLYNKVETLKQDKKKKYDVVIDELGNIEKILKGVLK